jgi:membrane protein
MTNATAGRRARFLPGRRSTKKSLGSLIVATFRGWIDDDAMRMSAALAFYTVWSLGPLFLVVLSVVGLAYGREAAEGHVVDALTTVVGPGGAKTIEDVIVHASASGRSVVANVVGIVMLVVSVSGVVIELKSSLDRVWRVPPKPASFLVTVKERFISLTMILGMAFLLLVSLLFNAALSSLGKRFGDRIPAGEWFWHGVHFAVSFALAASLFALMFKFIPDAKARWKDVWVGGAVTSALFTIGQVLIGLYVGKTNIASAYGAASSLMVILVWIFFSSCILFLGAELTRVYAATYGAKIVPLDAAPSSTTRE